MNLLRLAWKNIIHNPLTLLLNLILLALGIGLINFILLFNTQLKQKFENNLAGIDMVVGAKGSPLQMILSSMYQIDAPTGNISIKEAKPFLRDGHPLIKKAVPLSMGDSYRGYRIIGTDHSILELYGGELKEGKLWQNLYEVTVGANVAKSESLSLGSTFKSAHGFNDDEDLEHEHGALTVVGILEPTNSVLDQIILVSTESVWSVHDHDHDHEEENEEDSHVGHAHDDHAGHDHSGHDHSGHDHTEHDHASDHSSDHAGHNHDHAEDHSGHNHEHAHDHSDHSGHDHSGHEHAHTDDHRNDMSRAHLLTHADKDITSILIQFKSRTNFQALNMPRNINENTDLQAASPAYEINRLYDMMGIGTKALQWLALLISLVSAISIFVSLLNSLRQRKYELSLLRVLGGKPITLFSLILIEGLILALLGYVIGMLLSHFGMSLLGDSLSSKYNYQFQPWATHGKELLIFGITLLLGMGAAVIPAIMAYNTDIHKNLSVG